MLQNCYAMRTAPVLGAFAKLRQTTVTVVMSVCLSTLNISVTNGRVFMKFCVWWFFLNSGLIIWRVGGCFTLRVVYFHDISPNSSWNEKCVTQNFVRKIKTHISVQFSPPPPPPKILRDNVEEYGTARQATDYNTRTVQKVSVHFEYLENRPRGIDVTGQPVRGDVTVHPRTVTVPWG
jgi:hypothetical protein